MKKSFYFISMFAFVLMLTITSVFIVSFNESYFRKMYKKLEVAETIKVDEKTLMDVNHNLLEYIKGEQNSLDYSVEISGREVEFFNEKEKDHMVDVQILYFNALMVRNIAFIVSLFGLLVLISSKDYKNTNLIHEILGKVLLSYGLIIGAAAIVAIIDFDFFWTSFHELVFSNDLWLLNPATDRLIMMVPLEFFTGLVYRILGLITLIFLSLLASYKYLERKVIL